MWKKLVSLREGNSRKCARLDGMNFWVGTVSGAHCKQIGCVIHSGMLDSRYALHTYCFHCVQSKECVGNLSEVELEMVVVIK